MTPERYKRVSDLFQAAVERQPAEREEFLKASCGDDAALLAEVLSLLTHDHDAPDGLAENQVVAGGHWVREALAQASNGGEYEVRRYEHVPASIGRYRIIRRIGEGGMGVVYEALQDSPRRTVALKVIKAAAASPSLLRRFQREAHVLGQLRHPGIAQIFDAESTENQGIRQACFAMEFIRGDPLNAYADREGLGTRQRLDLFAKVCDAVEHAHRNGVIHRDLKPSNILVDEFGQPKILDFGVAHLTDVDMQTTLRTDVGQLVGTIPYMSPEQVMGDPSLIDPRSDVYSLGVVLYELLAGRLPYEVRSKPIPEAVRIIKEHEPTHLSSINTSFRGDVDTIVTKALEKDPQRRYYSAGELAADIRRYLRDEPIVARPTSTFYQLRKFAKRNKVLVTGLTTTMLLLAVITIRESIARRAAQWLAYRAGLAAAAAALRGTNCTEARRQLDQVPQRLRGWEWEHLHSQLDDSSAEFQVDAEQIFPFQFGRDGGIYTLTDRGQVRFGNPPSKRFEVLLLNLSSKHVTTLRTIEAIEVLVGFDARPNQVVYFDTDMSVYAEDAINGAGKIGFGTAKYDTQKSAFIKLPVVLSADGRRLFWFEAGKVLASEAGSRDRIRFGQGAPGHHRSGAISPDGALFAHPIGTLDNTEILVWDVESGELRHRWRGHKDTIWKMAFSPDISRLVSISLDHTVRQWLLDETQAPSWEIITDHTDRVLTMAFSPDGNRFATAGRDRTVRLWDSLTGKSLGVYLGHEDEIQRLVFSDDGQRLASGSADRTIRVWDVPEHCHPRVLQGHSSFVYAIAFSPDGSRIYSGAWDGRIRIWDADTGDEIVSWATDPAGAFTIVISLAVDPKGEHIAVCDRSWQWPAGARLRILDARTGNEKGRIKGLGISTSVAFRPEGSQIAVCDMSDGGLQVLDCKTLQKTAEARGREFCTYNRDGTLLATTDGSAVIIYRAETLEQVARLTGHNGAVHAAGFSPDGTRLATAGTDHTIRIWDMSSLEVKAVLRGHTDKVYAVIYSPDGRRIVSGSNDQTIRVWSSDTFDQIVQLAGHKDYVYSLAFSPDGSRLVSGSGDSTVRIWETDPIRVRVQAQRERQTMISRAAPLVDSLFARFNDPTRVAAKLNVDQTLERRFREIALQVLLARSAQSQDRRIEAPADGS